MGKIQSLYLNMLFLRCLLDISGGLKEFRKGYSWKYNVERSQYMDDI